MRLLQVLYNLFGQTSLTCLPCVRLRLVVVPPVNPRNLLALPYLHHLTLDLITARVLEVRLQPVKLRIFSCSIIKTITSFVQYNRPSLPVLF